VSGLFDCLHIADAVGVVTDQSAVFIDNRVDSTNHAGGIRKIIDQLTDFCLIRHGAVKTGDVHTSQPLYRIGKVCFRHIETKIDIVKIQQAESFIVHQRRDTVGNRASEKPCQLCVPVNHRKCIVHKITS